MNTTIDKYDVENFINKHCNNGTTYEINNIENNEMVTVYGDITGSVDITFPIYKVVGDFLYILTIQHY